MLSYDPEDKFERAYKAFWGAVIVILSAMFLVSIGSLLWFAWWIVLPIWVGCICVFLIVYGMTQPRQPTQTKICPACLKQIRKGEESAVVQGRHEWCETIV